MDVKDIMTFINNIGFPIFVAVYLMVRMERAMKDIGEAINKLSVIVAKLAKDED